LYTFLFEKNLVALYTIRKFVLNLTHHVSQTVHLNYYVNLNMLESNIM